MGNTCPTCGTELQMRRQRLPTKVESYRMLLICPKCPPKIPPYPETNLA